MIDNHDHLRSTSSQVGTNMATNYLAKHTRTRYLAGRMFTDDIIHTYLLTIHGLIGGVTVRSGLNRRRDSQQETARNMYV